MFCCIKHTPVMHPAQDPQAPSVIIATETAHRLLHMEQIHNRENNKPSKPGNMKLFLPFASNLRIQVIVFSIQLHNYFLLFKRRQLLCRGSSISILLEVLSYFQWIKYFYFRGKLAAQTTHTAEPKCKINQITE